MPREIKPQDRHPRAPDDLARDSSSPQRGTFRQEGEYWTIGYDSKVFRVRTSTGLYYIAQLLRYPGTEFHVLDLGEGAAKRDVSQDPGRSLSATQSISVEELEASGIHVGGLGDAGEMLDDRAKAVYKARLRELGEELEQAKEFGNVERAAKAEEEIDALSAELSRGIGLGGRRRRAGSATERARQRAKKGIKTAIDKIARNDPALGRMLSQRIRTGIYCCYRPDPNFPVEWQFSASAPDTHTPLASHELHPPPDSNEVRGQEGVQLDADVLAAFRKGFADKTSFVIRDAEESELRGVIDRSLGGFGSVAMLSGDPGVGKTRLAMEVSHYATGKNFRSFAGRCYERDQPVPYLPFAEILEAMLASSSPEEFRRELGDNGAELALIAPILRRVFPALPPPVELPAPQKRRYVFQSLAEFLSRSARRSPLFLVLDDLHWADESTLALLNFLANSCAQIPMVIVGTYRDTDLDSNPALARTLEELIRDGLHPTKLNGLREQGVAQMLQRLSLRAPPPQLVRLVFQETSGNPFFVEQLYRHLVEEGKIFDPEGEFRTDLTIDETEVPENVRLVLERRLQRLSSKARDILTTAAVIGRAFSFKLLETVLTHIDADDLLATIDKAQHMGLIVSLDGSEAPLNFTHELVRQTLLSRISKPRRQRLHLKVAEAIEQIWAGRLNEQTVELADHLLKAGPLADPAQTADYLLLVGRNSLEGAAYEEAYRGFKRALSYKEANLRWRAECLQGMQKAKRGLGNWEDALRYCNEAIEIYRELGDTEMTANVFLEAVDGLLWTGRDQEAGELARRGLAALKEEPSASRAQLLAALGEIYGVSGVYTLARDAFTEGVALAEQLSDRKLLSRILALRSVFHSQFLEVTDSLNDSRKSVELDQSDAWIRATALSRQLLALHCLGRVQEADRIRSELKPSARKIGHLGVLSFCLWTESWTEFGKAPDFIRLEEQLSESLEINRSGKVPRFLALVQLSLVKFLRGQQAAALDRAMEACALDAPESQEGFGIGALLRALAYAEDRAGAMALLDAMRGKLPRVSQPNTIGSWALLASVIEGMAVLGERGRAAEFHPLALHLLDSGAMRLAWIARFPQTIAGVAAGAAGQWESAEEHFHIALRQAEELPDQLEQAECSRFYGSMLLDRNASGDRERAHQLLNAAFDSYTRIGMPRHMDIVKALLNRSRGP